MDSLDDAAGEDQEQHAALRGEALSKLPQVSTHMPASTMPASTSPWCSSAAVR